MARGYAGEATGQSLTSMEICQEIMECEKALATNYTVAALEAADPSVRRTFRQMGRDCERVAYRAFEILHSQGHYDVKPASAAELRGVEDMLESFQRGHAVPNAQESRAPHSTWQRADLPENERGYAGERAYLASDRPFAGDRSFGTERGYAGERGHASERPFASERGYDRPYNADRSVAAGYGSDRYAPAYGSARAERADLPDWARSRN